MVKRRRKVEVDWIPDHESFRAVFGQSYPVVSDRDLLRAVVDLANGDTATVDSDDATHSYRANTFLERVQDGIGFKEAKSENTIDEAIAQDRERARLVLRAATEGQPSLELLLRIFVKLHPRGFAIVRRPSFGITSTGKVGIEWFLDLDAVPGTGGRRFDHALAYAAALLYSDEFQCRSKLRCCKLDSCGRFFYFEREPGKAGRPRDSYCSPEHMKIAHEKDSARRHREAKRARAEAKHTRKQQLRRHK